MLLSCVTCSSKTVADFLYIFYQIQHLCKKKQKKLMAATIATPVTPTELDHDRCGSEEETRGAEVEEESQQQQQQQHSGPAAAVTHNRVSKLPLSRIKTLMKTDPDVSLASQESVFIIAKATELFVEMIAKDALVYAQQGKRKTLQRKDLDNAIEAIDEFAFLEGTLD